MCEYATALLILPPTTNSEHIQAIDTCRHWQGLTYRCYILPHRAPTCEELCERARLDYRRLEEAHLKFCVLNVFLRYPATFPSWKLSTSISDTLDHITPLFYLAFEARYAGMCSSFMHVRTCVLI